MRRRKMKQYNNGEFRASDVGKTLTVYGWVNRRRDMGGVIFVDLRDRSGLLQVVFNRSYLKTSFDMAEKLRNEFCIKVTGELVARGENEINPNLSTGEVELMITELEILGESEAMPFNIYEEQKVNEEVGLKYRYLELRKERLQNNIKIRHQIMQSVREYLNNNNFLEIETPVLCKSTPEGARDYIVPSRVNKGSFYALPQSPQIFKQLLMVAGFEKYYQIAKCFRDEDLRADRQPEFTQIDLEMSFVEQEDVLNTVEAMVKKVVKDIKGIEIPTLSRMTYEEAMNQYGSDKPDTRFELYLNDITELLRDSKMNVFANAIAEGGIAKCLIVKQNKYPRNEIDRLTDFVKIYGAKGLAWLKYDNDSFTGVIAKNLESEKQIAIKEQFGVENGDLILICCGKASVVYASLGALRLKVARDFDLIDKSKLNFLWVTDFPMFEYSEEENRFKSMHHPFTKPVSMEALENKNTCLSIAYDIVLNGYELGGGSVRINDPKMQSKVFEALEISSKEAQDKFGFLLDAYKFGAPPHAGLAIGLERFTMILSETENMKDVIAFPKTQSASDLMSEAPNIVSKSQLEELGIKIIKEEDNE